MDQASEAKKFIKINSDDRRTARSLRQMAGRYTRVGSTAMD
jgi:hypothetical protein